MGLGSVSSIETIEECAPKKRMEGTPMKAMNACRMCVVLLTLGALSLVEAARAEELVELKLKLPGAKFDGTPKDIKSANLPKTIRDPKPLRVPKGLTNLALGKPVTSSESEPIFGELEQITDGDKEATDGSFIELGFGSQWV